MDNKNIFIVGGSSGIGLEIVKKLTGNQNEIFIGSRTNETLADYPEVHHLRLDVTEDLPDLEGLPDMLHGLIYCPGSIVLKPFQRLASADFQRDFEINLLGAVKVIQGCLKRLKKSPAETIAGRSQILKFNFEQRINKLKISDHQQSWGYEDGPWKGPGPSLLVAADF